MPSTFVFAIASASAAAATTNAIVSFRRQSSAKSSGGRRKNLGAAPSSSSPAAHGRRGAVRVAASCPEIEALKVKPSWHPEGSPEERVKQLGLELDGRIATNPAGTDVPHATFSFFFQMFLTANAPNNRIVFAIMGVSDCIDVVHA